jgi:hypothetical protein
LTKGHIPMHIQHFPGTVVRTGLGVVRLPLTAVEVIAGHNQDGTAWPPSLAFESFEAAAKQVAGSLLRDDTLVQEGRLAQAKVAQLRKATELEAVALSAAPRPTASTSNATSMTRRGAPASSASRPSGNRKSPVKRRSSAAR